MFKLLFLPLVIVCFWSGFKDLFLIYSRPWLYQNTLAALIIICFYLFVLYRSRRHLFLTKDFSSGFSLTLGFACLSLILILNNLFGGFQIVPPILAYLSLYFYLGFWFKSTFWRQSFFVFIFLILTLPLLDSFQKFIGFPLRLLTAQVVSFLLQLLGIGHFSQSTIIMTENSATSIDIPCSGVKSLYFGSIVLLATYFLHQVKFSLKALYLAFAFFFLLIFFNIWRVFSLVYLYSILRLVTLGDSLHLFLGVLGFVVSCLFLWYYTRRLSSIFVPSAARPQTKFPALKLCFLFLLFTTFLTQTIFKNSRQQFTASSTPSNFSVKNAILSSNHLTAAEKTLFFSTDVTFVAKYNLDWSGRQLSLLLVTSSSARSHHDPELCLQNLGYQLLSSETIFISQQPVKYLRLKNATVYYWFVSSDKIISDYSQRLWSQLRYPNQSWTLVELLVPDSQKISADDLSSLFLDLNNAVRSQLIK